MKMVEFYLGLASRETDLRMGLSALILVLLLVALYFIVPESSRWLIAQGKNEEAKENLSRRASFNK